MYEDTDINGATFRIPVSHVVKAAVKEAEQHKRQTVAPVVDTSDIELTPPQAPLTAQVEPVAPIEPAQSITTTQLTALPHEAKTLSSDKMLFNELSAVSDEVLACRNKVLSDVS